MPKGLTDPQHYQDIADAIRGKNGSTGTYTPAQMANAIESLTTADSLPDADIMTFPDIYLSNVSWADGSDLEIGFLLLMANKGEIDLYEDAGWRVGDTRTVSLSAMSATGVGESHVAQDVEIVLVNKGGYTTTDGKSVQFVWQLKDFLANGTSGEWGYMNSSNTNSDAWNGCVRRTWCNSVFYNALPSYLKSHVKKVNVVTANGSSSTTATSEDWCFLPAEKEVFGSVTHANSTAENSLSQWTWYATASNRVKHVGKNGSTGVWWERSPSSDDSAYFCYVASDRSARSGGASNYLGLAPCGCIGIQKGE